MQIPRRPKELRTTLRHHAGREDAPVFVYRFPTPDDEVQLLYLSLGQLRSDPRLAAQLQEIEDKEEMARKLEQLLEAEEGWGYGTYLCRVFDRQILRIEQLEIGDEPFDRQKHLDDVPGDWKLEVAREIQTRMKDYVTEEEEGNSSSPSSSGDARSTASPSMPDALSAGA